MPAHNTQPKAVEGDGERTRLMRVTLERGLTQVSGRPVRIRAFHSEFYPGSTSFRTEKLRVQLDDGRRLSVFFKDLNPRNLLHVARRIRARELHSSRLEWRMYRAFLSPERLGTPRLYASLWQPQRGLTWLFLEDVGNLELNFVGKLEIWLAAARWAARLHAMTRHLPPARTRFIPRLGRAHYRGCAEEAERRFSALTQAERRLMRQALDQYRARAHRLTELPQSVIHGQFFGGNILLRRWPAAQRITVVDWESAAYGPSYLDVVSLSSGRWTKRQKAALRNAYFEEYQAATGKRLEWESFCRDLNDLGLYQALTYLAPTMRKTSIRYLVAKRKRWIRELRGLLEERGVCSTRPD